MAAVTAPCHGAARYYRHNDRGKVHFAGSVTARVTTGMLAVQRANSEHCAARTVSMLRPLNTARIIMNGHSERRPRQLGGRAVSVESAGGKGPSRAVTAGGGRVAL
eukprot:3088345-Rhodomonas_salina.1